MQQLSVWKTGMEVSTGTSLGGLVYSVRQISVFIHKPFEICHIDHYCFCGDLGFEVGRSKVERPF